ncbi:MAG: metallophosphoesterase [Balneolaceae bacterium]
MSMILRILQLSLVLSIAPLAGISQTGNGAENLKIVLISDLNESYGSTHYKEYVDSTLAFIREQKPDLVLCTGDMVAGQSLSLSEDELREMWQGFDETIGDPLRELSIPFAFTLGNHDGSGSGNFDHERQIAKEYWSERKPDLSFVDSAQFPFYYSFVFNDLFFISWDASYQHISEEERNWVEEQLSGNDADKAALKLMLGHLPLYAVAEGRNHSGEVLSDADELFELMKREQLNYYFSGHHHAWYAAEKEGVKMIHSGAQGGGPRMLIGSDTPPRRTVTLLEKYPGESDFQITSFDLENNMKPIKSDELPARIDGFNGTLFRYDY